MDSRSVSCSRCRAISECRVSVCIYTISPCRCVSPSQWVVLDVIFNLKEQTGKNRIENYTNGKEWCCHGYTSYCFFSLLVPGSWLNAIFNLTLHTPSKPGAGTNQNDGSCVRCSYGVAAEYLSPDDSCDSKGSCDPDLLSKWAKRFINNSS